MSTIPAPKPFYTINEVAQLADVKPHVLRYWETEFPQLDPEKNPAGQRVYRPKHVDMVLRIRDLLYAEEYTIAGAKRRLDEELARSRREQIPLALNLREAEVVATLMRVKRQVKSLLDDVERNGEGEAETTEPHETQDHEPHETHGSHENLGSQEGQTPPDVEASWARRQALERQMGDAAADDGQPSLLELAGEGVQDPLAGLVPPGDLAQKGS